jgi:hypothetical protein
MRDPSGLLSTGGDGSLMPHLKFLPCATTKGNPQLLGNYLNL